MVKQRATLTEYSIDAGKPKQPGLCYKQKDMSIEKVPSKSPSNFEANRPFLSCLFAFVSKRGLVQKPLGLALKQGRGALVCPGNETIASKQI